MSRTLVVLLYAFGEGHLVLSVRSVQSTDNVLRYILRYLSIILSMKYFLYFMDNPLPILRQSSIIFLGRFYRYTGIQ